MTMYDFFIISSSKMASKAEKISKFSPRFGFEAPNLQNGEICLQSKWLNAVTLLFSGNCNTLVLHIQREMQPIHHFHVVDIALTFSLPK